MHLHIQFFLVHNKGLLPGNGFYQGDPLEGKPPTHPDDYAFLCFNEEVRTRN